MSNLFQNKNRSHRTQYAKHYYNRTTGEEESGLWEWRRSSWDVFSDFAGNCDSYWRTHSHCLKLNFTNGDLFWWTVVTILKGHSMTNDAYEEQRTKTLIPDFFCLTLNSHNALPAALLENFKSVNFLGLQGSCKWILCGGIFVLCVGSQPKKSPYVVLDVKNNTQ